jgi:hypothetical protein
MTTYAGRPVFAPFFTDPSGNPQELVSITIYNRGTVVKPTLYTSRTKATPLANPFTADSLGNAEFYVDPGEYDALVNGVTLPFSSVPDPVEPLDDAAVLAAIPSGTYVQQVAGVETDGTTSSSVVIQAAVDAASAAGIAAGGPSRVVLPPGRVIRANIVLKPRVIIDLNGSVLKPAVGSNADAIKGLNFDTLTGKAYAVNDMTRGAYQSGVVNGTIDGDKANQSAGWGFRVWGRSLVIENVVVQNCNDGGIWTEFTTHDGITSDHDAIEGSFVDVKTLLNGGDGWRHRGPHDASLTHFITMGNAGWGFKSETTAGSWNGGIRGSHWNAWANADSFHFGGATNVLGIDATGTNTGIGIEQAAGTGNMKLLGMTVAGHTSGFIARGTGHQISGTLANNPGNAFILDGIGNSIVTINGSGNTGAIHKTSESEPNQIVATFSVDVGQTLLTGSGLNSNGYYVIMGHGDAGPTDTIQLPTRTLTAAGYSPELPQENGTLVTTSQTATLSNKALGFGSSMVNGANLPVGDLDGTSFGTAANQILGFHGARVVQAAAIASPAGGATVDAEARTAITALLVAMRAKGLIAT